MIRATMFLLVPLVAIAASPRRVHAVSCTVQGTMQVQSMDTYYCDTDILSCISWKESALDTTLPLKNVGVTLYDSSGGWKGTDVTDQNGFYSITASFTACNQPIEVRIWLQGHQGTGGGSYVFRVTGPGPDYLTHAIAKTATLNGSVTTVNNTIMRSSNATLNRRLGTIYQTANSALEEIQTWSANIDWMFGSYGNLRIEYHSGNAASDADPDTWSIRLGYDRYQWGANTRHEIGHIVHDAVHHGFLNPSCYSLQLNQQGVNAHIEDSCEYAFTATWEGLATFFAVSSIAPELGSDSNRAFFCFCNQPPTSNQDICSDVALTALADDDRTVTCTGGYFAGVGDTYANSTSTCSELWPALGCSCTDSNGNTECDDPWPGATDPPWNQSNGHRSEQNVYRYFWDIIDISNDSGLDDTNLSMQDLVAGLEGMPCTGVCDGPGGGVDDCGVDGTCNEPGKPWAWYCNPVPTWTEPTSHTTGDRDSYNPSDLSENTIIPGSQWGERQLNCVHNAPDF